MAFHAICFYFITAGSQAETVRIAVKRLLSLADWFKQLNLGKIYLKVYKSFA